MASPSFLSKLFDRISVQERINFARHLSLVVKAGLPVFQGLKIIETQTESPVLKNVVKSLIEDVNNGKFLADGLQKFEHLFGPFFINIVRVGESSGTLSKNLLYLADELKRSRELQTKVRSAMIYPMVILVATLAVAGFLTFYIFPKLIPVFSGMKVQLPLTTRTLLGILDFVKKDGLYTLVGLAAFTVFCRIVVKKVKAVRYFFNNLLFYIPVVSNLTISVNMVNFTRVLGLLLKSGVKIVEAIQITGSTFNNLVYQHFLAESGEEIKKGGQLGLFIAKHKRFFPPLVSGMVQIGESTGNLEENLEYLAEYYDDEVDTKLHALTSLIEPLMLLVMGGLVGFVALSIITPIYSISQGIQ
jgi:type II secretory pathway component PulF